MAETETRYNPATKRYEGDFQKKADEGAVAGSAAGAAARDASKLGAKKTGAVTGFRARRDGEDEGAYNERIKRAEAAGLIPKESPQKEAFKGMLDAKKPSE